MLCFLIWIIPWYFLKCLTIYIYIFLTNVKSHPHPTFWMFLIFEMLLCVVLPMTTERKCDRFRRGVKGPGGATCRLKGTLLRRLGGTFDALSACSCSSSCPGKKWAGGVGCGRTDDRGEGDRIKTRRLVAGDDSEEGRGCTVVSFMLG